MEHLELTEDLLKDNGINTEDNICDSCKYGDKDCNEKPCNSCMQWSFEGYLDAANYEPE